MSRPFVRRGRGLLIAVEGVDGVGKTTNTAALVEHLRTVLGLDVLVDKEPTNGPHGKRLRASAHTGRLEPRDELDAFVADRLEHVEQVIRPALRSGQIVVLDRYFYSNVAYQGARGISPYEILARNLMFAPPADIVVLLQMDPVRAVLRVRKREPGGTENAFEQAAYLCEVDRVYRAHVQTRPGAFAVDADRKPPEVAADVIAGVSERLLSRA